MDLHRRLITGLSTEDPMEAIAPLRESAARRLARSDLDAVVAIDALLEGQTRRTYFERRLASALREPEMHLQFAIDDADGLAGYILARVLEGEFGRASPGVRLETIGVRPDAKGHHLGRRLLDGLADGAKRRGIGDLRTAARWNDHAMLRWLDEHGFTLAPNLVVDRALDATAIDAPVDRAVTLEAARALATRLQRHGTVGLSSYYAEPTELARALQEAELVLDVLRQSDAALRDTHLEDIGTGTYRLLFRVLASHPEEVRSFYEDTVAPITRYDDQYATDLAGTLESYLEHNCNMNATAAAIYAHRHTVAYRLERVRELTGLDPMQSEDRERLGPGLKPCCPGGKIVLQGVHEP